MLLNRVVRSFNFQRMDYDFEEPMFEDVLGTPRLTSVGGMADSWEWTCSTSKTAGKIWTAPQRVRLNDRLRVEGWNPASGWSLWMVIELYQDDVGGFPVVNWLCIGEGKGQFDSALRIGDRMTLIRVRKDEGGFFWIPMGPRWRELRYGTKPPFIIAGDGMFNVPESEMKEKLEGKEFFIKGDPAVADETVWECENEVTVARVAPFGNVELYNLCCVRNPVGSILVPSEGTPLAPFKPDFEVGDEIIIRLDGFGRVISVDLQPVRFKDGDVLRLGLASKTGSVAEVGPLMESKIPISEIRPEMVLTLSREQGEWKSAAVFQPIEMTMTADVQRMYQLGDPSPYFMPSGVGQKGYEIRLKCIYGVMLSPGMTLEITPQMKTPPGAGVSLPKPEKPKRAALQQAYLDKVRQKPYLDSIDTIKDITKRTPMEVLPALRRYVADGPPRLMEPPKPGEPLFELFEAEKRLKAERDARQPKPDSIYTPQEEVIFAIAKDLDEGRVPTKVGWPLSAEDMAWVTNNGIPTGYREVVAARLFVAQESERYKKAQKAQQPFAILNDPDDSLVGSQDSLMRAYRDLKTGRVPPSTYLPLGPNTIRKLRGFVSGPRSVSDAAKYILQMAKIPVSLDREIAQAYRKLADEGFPITDRPAYVAYLTMDADILARLWELARSGGLMGRQAKAVLAYGLLLQFAIDGRSPADLTGKESILFSEYVDGEMRRRIAKRPLDEVEKILRILGPLGQKPAKEALIDFARELDITVYAGDTVEVMNKSIFVDLLQGGLRYESTVRYGEEESQSILEVDVASIGRAVRQVSEQEARKAKVTDEGKVEDLRPPSNPLGKRKISWDD